MPMPTLAPRIPRWLRGLALAGWALLAPAQESAFRHFGLEDGLPQSQVTVLMEDHHGFLWVGTNTNGLARLAAGKFTPFGIAQGLQARSVSAILEDPDGHIWAAGLDNGLSEIIGTETRNYGPNDGLGSSQIFSLALDPEGRVLAGTRLGLYRQLPNGGFSLVRLEGAWAGQPIYALRQDGKGHVWVLSRKGLIGRWDGTSMEEHPLPPNPVADPYYDLELDPAGVPYLMLQDRILRLEKGRWTPLPLPGVPPTAKIRSLTFGGGGMQISLGEDGLWLMGPDGTITILHQQDGLPHEAITAVLLDRQGVLWIGSDGDGLQALVLPKLQSVTRGGPRSDGLGAVMGILELQPGHYLLACSTGIYEYRDGKGVVRGWSKKDGLPSDECWAPLADGAGGAWIGTDRGLVHWHPDGRFTPGPKEMARSTVVDMIRMGDRIFAGTDQGLFELDGEGRFLHQWHPPQVQSLNQVYNLVKDGNELLVGLRLGLYVFKEGTWEKRYVNAPFANQSVNAMVRDPDGHMWVGTTAGLYEEDGTGWKSHGIPEGLPDDNISFIQFIGSDRVAIGHGIGVSILDRKGPGARLTHSLGLLSDETNHDGVLLDSYGRLWIGMIGGANILNDAATFTSPGMPAPVVRELRWPGGTLLYPTRAELPPHPANMVLSFEVGAPLVPDQPRMEALLEGVDSVWRGVEGTTLHYLNLSGGHYRFRLRASADGIHWQESQPVVLIVHSAWYEKAWVRVLALLTVLLLLGGLVYWRMSRMARQARRLEAKVAERTVELARQNRALEDAHDHIKRDLEARLGLMDMVTHDLRSPLTSLTLSVDRLLEGPEDAEERDMLHGILHRETQRMESMVRQLLDRSRTESFFQSVDLRPCSPMDLVRGMEEVLRFKASAKNLNLEIEAAPDTSEVKVLADPNAMQQVLLNLFENALKFTPEGGTIGIRSTVEKTPGMWRLEVWDTGRGLTEEEAEQILHPFAQAKPEDAARGWGLGLSICLSLLELQSGELRVRSTPGHGAAFIISLPLHQP